MAAKRYRPQLTDAAKPSTFEVEAVNERGEMVPTAVAGEHPLTLYLDKKELVTLMTLGHAPEALAIGYLRNQRLVSSIDEIKRAAQIAHCEEFILKFPEGYDTIVGERGIKLSG